MLRNGAIPWWRNNVLVNYSPVSYSSKSFKAPFPFFRCDTKIKKSGKVKFSTPTSTSSISAKIVSSRPFFVISIHGQRRTTNVHRTLHQGQGSPYLGTIPWMSSLITWWSSLAWRIPSLFKSMTENNRFACAFDKLFSRTAFKLPLLIWIYHYYEYTIGYLY